MMGKRVRPFGLITLLVIFFYSLLSASQASATSQDSVINTFTFSSTGASAISPDGTFALITSSSGNQAYRLNLLTNVITDTYTVTGDSYRTAISPDGQYGIVLNYTGGTVSKITFSNGAITNYSGFSNPRSVAFIPNTSVALIANWGSTSVSRIDVSTDSITSLNFGLATNPLEVSISPDGSKALFSVWNSNLSTLVNLSNNTIIRSYSTTGPGVSKWTSDGSVIYQTSQSSSFFYKIDPNSSTITAQSIATSAYGLTIGRDNSFLLIALSGGSLIRVSTSTLTTAATYTGYSMPWDLQEGYNSIAGEFVLFTDRNTRKVYRIFESLPISVASLSLSPSQNPGVFRTSMNLTASSNYAGKVTFYADGKKIPTCVNIQTVLNVTNDAVCLWRPSVHKTVILYAIVSPSTTGVLIGKSQELRIPVSARATNR